MTIWKGTGAWKMRREDRYGAIKEIVNCRSEWKDDVKNYIPTIVPLIYSQRVDIFNTHKVTYIK